MRAYTLKEAEELSVGPDVVLKIVISDWPLARLMHNCWYCGAMLADMRGFSALTMHGGNDVEIPDGYQRLHRDHQLPRSRGGTNRRSNIVDACLSCNSRKHNKTVEEYRHYLQAKYGRPIVFYGELSVKNRAQDTEHDTELLAA